MYTHEEAATIGPVTARSTISWGAIIAALFAMLATTFLLLLLGSAIGFSVADATDLGAIGNGLGIGTVIWIIGTTLVVSLIGGLLAAHLSGRRGHDAGLMHGVVVWAVAILAALIIDTMMVSAAVRGTAAAVGNTAQAAMSLGGKMLSGVRLTGQGIADLASSQYTEQVRAELRKAAVNALAGADAEGGASASESDIRDAIDILDPDLIRDAAQQVIAGNPDQAQALLLQELNMSRSEAKDLLEGIGNELESLEESEAVQRVMGTIENRLDDLAGAVADAAGPEVSRAELRDALAQLDVELSTEIARSLLQGDVDGARQALVTNTDFTTAEIDAIVAGVESQLKEAGEDLVQQVEQDVEAISDYVQVLLWLFFIGSALSLAAAAMGGFFGARDDDEEVYVAARERTTVS
jgi:hypothetical protein